MSNPTRLHVPALAVTVRTTPEPEVKQEVLKYLRSQGLTETPGLADKVTSLALDRAGVADTAPLRAELKQLIARAGSGLLEAIQRAPKELVAAAKPVELSGPELRFWPRLPREFHSTADVQPPEPFIGQDRLREALALGLSLDAPDYNVLISGLSGKAAIDRLAAEVLEVAKNKPVPDDQVFVPSFANPLQPRAIRVPAGKGFELRAAVEGLARFIETDLAGQLAAAKEGDADTKQLEAKSTEAFTTFQEAGKQLGVIITKSGDAVSIAPADENGEAMVMSTMNDAQKAEFAAKVEQLKAAAMPAYISAVNTLEAQQSEAGKRLLAPTAKAALEPKLAAITEAIGGDAEVKEYLDALLADVLERLPAVTEATQRYAVHVTVDNTGLTHAPVVVANDATAEGLFGAMRLNPLLTSAMVDGIEMGDLARANGGYLVIDLSRLARNSETAIKLLDALAAGELHMTRTARAPRSPLSPQPFPLNVKVIAIGTSDVVEAVKTNKAIASSDVFKATATFDPTLPNDEPSAMAYAGRIGEICRNEGVPHFDGNAVAAVLEHSARSAGGSSILEALPANLEDIVREAALIAGPDAEMITGAHVTAALEGRVRRANLDQEAMLARIIDGTKLIDVTGAKVGQINGLAVLQAPGHTFGLPSRITASVAVGQAGLINIERQADFSGSSHNKGIEILQGYLRERFGNDKPLAMTASIAFEQMYGGVDGDSASSTELYAMLSKLSGVPIRQGIAVTGSVNQRGEVQAIGGVNHKVEGFFDVCKARGLTGTQGVLIPISNMEDLVLRPDVVAAVAKGEFHIYPVKTIDQGIEILTGVAAGDLETPGTINYLTDQRLRGLTNALTPAGQDELAE